MSIIKTGEKTGVKVREYQGNYSLQACYNEYVNWCKPKTGKESYAEKDRPIEVSLGDKETALKVLKQVYAEIAGSALEEDVPF